MTVRKIALILAFLCILPASAMADDEGVYIALNVGKGSLLHGCGGQAGVVSPCSDNKAHSYFATYGYQYTPMWGLEANYGKVGNAGALLALALTFEGVATLHMGDFLSVFVKAGVAYADFRQTISPPVLNAISSGYSPAGGAGLQFDFTPKLAMRVQADYFGSYSIVTGAPKVHMLTATAGLMAKY